MARDPDALADMAMGELDEEAPMGEGYDAELEVMMKRIGVALANKDWAGAARSFKEAVRSCK